MAVNEAKWPPSPCERIMNKEGSICAIAATYRPGLYAYLCNQHTDEATRRLQRINVELIRALEDCAERMERGRSILTDDNPRPRAWWGVLDTAQSRAAIAAARGTA